jgi:hypothetical protein
MSALGGDNPQPTDASQIDGPWDGWVNALLDVLKGYDKVSSDKASGKWFLWRVTHLCDGLRDAGCGSYARWLRPEQYYLPPTGQPPNKPILVCRHLHPLPINQPPHVEIAALRAVKTCLEYVYDDPANHRTPAGQEPLSPDQKKDLRRLEETAMREVKDRLRVLESNELETTHNEDFTSVRWYGVPYPFSKGRQADSVRVLWEAWEKKTPRLSEKAIGEKIESSSDRFRLYHVFNPKDSKSGKRKPHPAWGTMIIRVGKGIFALSPP